MASFDHSSCGRVVYQDSFLDLFCSIEVKKTAIHIRVGPQNEKSSNLYITADSTGSIHKNAREKKFDPKKSSSRVWGFDLKIWDLGIFSDICTFF